MPISEASCAAGAWVARLGTMADWQEQVVRDAQNYRDLKVRLDAAAITETDGLVTVTVSAAGLLTNLELDEPWNPCRWPT